MAVSQDLLRRCYHLYAKMIVTRRRRVTWHKISIAQAFSRAAWSFALIMFVRFLVSKCNLRGLMMRECLRLWVFYTKFLWVCGMINDHKKKAGHAWISDKARHLLGENTATAVFIFTYQRLLHISSSSFIFRRCCILLMKQEDVLLRSETPHLSLTAGMKSPFSSRSVPPLCPSSDLRSGVWFLRDTICTITVVALEHKMSEMRAVVPEIQLDRPSSPSDSFRRSGNRVDHERHAGTCDPALRSP